MVVPLCVLAERRKQGGTIILRMSCSMWPLEKGVSVAQGEQEEPKMPSGTAKAARPTAVDS